MVRFRALGNAPTLNRTVYKITATNRFASILQFLRKQLKLKPAESINLYINMVFSPALDEIVGNLYRCFKSGEELVVAYSTNPAFG
jgi:ubiquitin-like protein ATG12